jgi:VIT1/CCC1 family predicted Fe2+/Mn2+ transporter
MEPDREMRRRAALLAKDHTPHAVSRRLGQRPSPSYLHDFIYGAVDGAVTTFAVVAGVAGASLNETVVIILGGANLVADGFSMAASNFLGSRAERQQRDRARREEQLHIRLVPEGEREEIRQIYAAKGFAGQDLERVVDVITSDRELWAETMVSEELGFASIEPNEYRAALSTLAAFLTVGFLPLLVYVYDLAAPGDVADPFAWSALMTGVAFVVVGAVKSRFVDQAWWRSALETLTVGGLAAALAYAAGAVLQNVA